MPINLNAGPFDDFEAKLLDDRAVGLFGNLPVADAEGLCADLVQPVIDRGDAEQLGDRLVIEADEGKIVGNPHALIMGGDHQSGGYLISGDQESARRVVHGQDFGQQPGAILEMHAVVEDPGFTALTSEGSQRVQVCLIAGGTAGTIPAVHRVADSAVAFIPQVDDCFLERGIMIEINAG